MLTGIACCHRSRPVPRARRLLGGNHLSYQLPSSHRQISQSYVMQYALADVQAYQEQFLDSRICTALHTQAQPLSLCSLISPYDCFTVLAHSARESSGLISDSLLFLSHNVCQCCAYRVAFVLCSAYGEVWCHCKMHFLQLCTSVVGILNCCQILQCNFMLHLRQDVLDLVSVTAAMARDNIVLFAHPFKVTTQHQMP